MHSIICNFWSLTLKFTDGIVTRFNSFFPIMHNIFFRYLNHFFLLKMYIYSLSSASKTKKPFHWLTPQVPAIVKAVLCLNQGPRTPSGILHDWQDREYWKQHIMPSKIYQQEDGLETGVLVLKFVEFKNSILQLNYCNTSHPPPPSSFHRRALKLSIYKYPNNILLLSTGYSGFCKEF